MQRTSLLTFICPLLLNGLLCCIIRLSFLLLFDHLRNMNEVKEKQKGVRLKELDQKLAAVIIHPKNMLINRRVDWKDGKKKRK